MICSWTFQRLLTYNISVNTIYHGKDKEQNLDIEVDLDTVCSKLEINFYMFAIIRS